MTHITDELIPGDLIEYPNGIPERTTERVVVRVYDIRPAEGEILYRVLSDDVDITTSGTTPYTLQQAIEEGDAVVHDKDVDPLEQRTIREHDGKAPRDVYDAKAGTPRVL